MYQGERRLTVHGASSHKFQGNRGLLAGCAFAKNVLKAFLEPIKQHVTLVCRDYVDDITLTKRGPKDGAVITELYAQLQVAKQGFTDNHTHGDKLADELATEGIDKHIEDTKEGSDYARMKEVIIMTQSYLLRRQGPLADRKS